MEYNFARYLKSRIVQVRRYSSKIYRGEGLAIAAPLELLRAAAARVSRVRRRALGLLGLAILGCGALAVTLFHPEAELSRLQIEKGDSLASLFGRANLPDHELLAVMEASHGAAFGLALVPGEQVRIIRRDDGGLGRLIVDVGGGEATEFVSNEAGQFTIVRRASSDATSLPKPADDEAPRPMLSGGGSLPEPDPRPADRLRRSGGPAEPDTPDTGPTTLQTAAREDAPSPADSMERVTVRNGDNLYLIFRRNGLPQGDLLDLLSSGKEGKGLKRLSPGQYVAFARGPAGEVAEFHHQVDELTTVRFTRDTDGFTPRVVTREYNRQIAVKNGVIRSSLFAAADGVPEPIVHKLVSVLEWDIDFSRDLRRGDSFSLLYEELHVDGRRVRTGNVLALEFRSQRTGKPIRAFRYTDTNGNTDYFTPEGHSLRRAFTRNPLRFTRISSRFSKSRLHPVLKTKRPHRGVDYAAPRGTRIRATGDGVVSFVGRKGGYGKTIVLTHGRGYTTLYGHMSRYAKGIRKGARIEQGQLIGYVGSTGLSTGPHLHYEFRVNGVHRDPLTVKLPRSAPLDERELKRFRNTIEPLVARIDTLGAVKLARLDR